MYTVCQKLRLYTFIHNFNKVSVDFQNYFFVVFSWKFATRLLTYFPHTLDVSLHNLAKLKI